jgi:glutaconate CoA-transferase subunit A
MTYSTNKLATLQEAAALVPASGATLALGGVTLYRRPMAFSMALLARHQREAAPRELTLLCYTAGLESDVLVGAGMVERVRSCYFGLEAFGLAPHFTEGASRGDFQIVEETEASLAYGLRATLAGVGFMPSTAWQGTDLLGLRPDVKQIDDPYTGERLTAFPAIRCDVAVIHALRADPEGNADIGKNWGVDRELALVARTVVITAEEILPKLSHAEIIGSVVTAVVHAPRGAWPTSCHPSYPLDGLATLQYSEQATTPGYAQLMNEWARAHDIPWNTP